MLIDLHPSRLVPRADLLGFTINVNARAAPRRPLLHGLLRCAVPHGPAALRHRGAAGLPCVPPRLPATRSSAATGRTSRLGGRAARASTRSPIRYTRARRRRHERRARDAPDAALGPPRQLVRHRGPRADFAPGFRLDDAEACALLPGLRRATSVQWTCRAQATHHQDAAARTRHRRAARAISHQRARRARCKHDGSCGAYNMALTPLTSASLIFWASSSMSKVLRREICAACA